MEAAKQVGFCAEARRKDKLPTPVQPELVELHSMAEVAPTETMRVLGGQVHVQVGHDLEFAQLLANTWKAFHTKARTGAEQRQFARKVAHPPHVGVRFLRMG